VSRRTRTGRDAERIGGDAERVGRDTERRVEAERTPIDISEQDGVRYLHFGSPWIQGAMRLRRPFQLELDYVRHMMAWLLFLDPPSRILQLGLGAAALTKFCHRAFPASEVTAVECSESVIAACRQWFALPADGDRLEVVRADAGRYVARPRNRRRFGVIQVDLYDRAAHGPVLDSLPFYRDCRRCLEEPGVLVVNLFGSDHRSFETSRARLFEIFDGNLLVLPPVEAGNLVVLAFNGPPLRITGRMLFERADEVERRWRLPARGWAKATLGAISG
jgi:spermidine synthase